MFRQALALIAFVSVIASSSAIGAQAFKPNAPGGSEPEHYNCGEEMGTLRPVQAQEIRAIGPGVKIWIRPVCQNMGGEAQSSGNGGFLHGEIARNPLLVKALADDDYLPKHVVGIAFGKNSVFLYVHKD